MGLRYSLPISATMELTETEKEIFAMVREICMEFDPPVVARAAGGWVRDRLLGKASDDLDIAVENTTGVEFAKKIKEKNSGKLVVIQANPEQSKHLETARVCLNESCWIDICGLRSEEYASDSRIPTASQGTPAEDAKRRDFTINALFYNINTGEIEDYVGGRKDLESGFIRTPLDPVVSFSDDPLRILRGFRFGSRFGFRIDPAIIEAAKVVHDDFVKKIARNRIVVELTKSFESKNPVQVVEWLIDSELFDYIFCDGWELDHDGVIDRVRQTSTSLVSILAAIYLPIGSSPPIKDPKKHNKLMPAIEYAVARYMMFPLKTAEKVNTIVTGALNFGSIVGELTRMKVGKWIRSVGELWTEVPHILYNKQERDFFTNVFTNYVYDQQLQDVWDLKPFIHGNEISSILGVKPGKLIHTILDDAINYMIENPSATKDDFIPLMKEKYSKTLQQ